MLPGILPDGLMARGWRAPLPAPLLTFQAGDKRCEVVGMGSDIPKRTSRAALRGVGSPGSLFLTGLFERRREPVLRVFHLHYTNRPQLSIRYHLARLPNHGMTGV